MTVNSQRLLLAAGAAAAGGALYVDDVFSTHVYPGNTTTQSIVNGIDLSGEGGLVWLKNRTDATVHGLYDTARGTNKRLSSDGDGTEQTDNGVTAFNNNGFTVGQVGLSNENNKDYVSWTFRKAPGFCNIVTYTGNATTGGDTQVINHSLGSVPGLILVKRRSSTDNWGVWHRSRGATKYLRLDEDGAEVDSADMWNDTEPTSTNFTVGWNGKVNTNGETYVAYIFAHDDQSFGTDSDEAIIKCGSYTGNGANGGKTIDLGFEPQWVMLKAVTSATVNDWQMYDVMRGIYGYQPGGSTVNSALLYANKSQAESDDYQFGVTPTGFIAIDGHNNNNNVEYIYIAIRRSHKPPEAGTDVFAIDVNTQSEPEYVSNFVVDWAFHRNVSYADNFESYARALGPVKLELNTSSAESANTAAVFDFMDGWGDNLANDTNYRSWMFRRAAGFFDVVAYDGTGSAHTETHNLAATPEFIIARNRDIVEDWTCYHSALGATKYIQLNGVSGEQTLSTIWNNTAPTSTNFTVGTQDRVNGNNYDYVAYLFATLTGISKVGSYTGTGSNIGVDCGFTAGARFVLIKRTDGNGDWFLYDSDRGIVGGNDPYLQMHTAAQVTNTDYIDPLNSGFTVTSSAPAALNASGGTYLFLAIA